MQQLEYLDHYEQRLHADLLQMLRSRNQLPQQDPLPSTPDITDLWLDRLAPAYCADAVKEIAQYPLVALGWAMYVGMAMAKYWDDDWATYSHHPNLYEHLRDVRGFDYLDEVVRTDLYGYRPDSKSLCLQAETGKRLDNKWAGALRGFAPLPLRQTPQCFS